MNGFFYGRYCALRPYVFSKLFLVMVALDTWQLMIGHAGRYGVASFNVAHFSWLDRVAPLPTPALYVGVLLLTGMLALTVALFGDTPAALTLLFSLYTYSWAMSMLDSYQHHYFVSLVLLCMVFFPRLRLPDVVDTSTRTARLTSGIGFPLLAATITVLYVFTALAKMDAQWCHGYTLQRISRAGKVFAPLLVHARSLGVADQTFWSVVSTSVIPVELTIAVGYTLALTQDQAPSRWRPWVAGSTCLLAVSLHAGAELLGLDIGWFSYYMFALAFTFLLPTPVIELAARGLARLLQRLQPSAAAKNDPRSFETLVLTGAVCAALEATAYLIDLPGALAAASCAAVGLAAVVGWMMMRARGSDARRAAFAVGFSAIFMWLAIARSEVRWDYYRFLGGDLQRRGESRAALDAYVKGERYAPKGSSRRDKIDQLRRELGL